MELPTRFEEGTRFTVRYGEEVFRYEIKNIDDNIVTITDHTTDRGTFDVDQYEIADMMNGGDVFTIIR